MNIDFSKNGGLVPVIIQDDRDLRILMLGYMNEDAYNLTLEKGRVTFFSRSRNRLWTKGETSGNYLEVKQIMADCDNDTILIKVVPAGPVCHQGTTSCFRDESAKGFLYQLENTIDSRINEGNANSYTSRLYKKGINKVAQKVGEEAVELIIEAKDDNADLFREEAADLLYHFLILMRSKMISLEEIEEVLRRRSLNSVKRPVPENGYYIDK